MSSRGQNMILARQQNDRRGKFAHLLPAIFPTVCVTSAPPGLVESAPFSISFESHRALYYTDAMSARALRPKDLKLSATIYRPPGKGPFPAVIINHGSGGLRAHHFEYAKMLLKEGFAVALFDGFCARGLTSTVGKQESLSLVTSIADNYALLSELTKLSFIDKKNVGAMGTSRGGSTLILAADEKIRKRFAHGDLRFSAFAAVYPGCSTHLKTKSPSSTKVLIQLASEDQYFPPDQCRKVYDEMKSAGFRLEKTEYKAPHGWDSGGKAAILPKEYNFGSCNMVVDSTGIPVEMNSGIRIENADSARKAYQKCGRLGAAIGADEAARRKSSSEVLMFFKRELKTYSK
jgi:dienelactone hydrolase